jgi:hypothetical protein
MTWITLCMLGHATAAAAPLGLSASAMNPGEPGSFTVDGAETPLAEGLAVWFMMGAEEGDGGCPSYLDGACWGITAPRYVQVAWTDAEGVATWTLEVDPAIALDTSRSFQSAVADAGGARLSNPVTVTVEEPAPPVDCPGDWLVGTPCNGTDFGGGCTTEETGYHYSGVHHLDGTDYACWWHTKNQAWNTTADTNFYALATEFDLDAAVGGSTWCYPRAADPCAGIWGGACDDAAGARLYFQEDHVGAWGWCGGEPFSSGGHVCFPVSPELAASCG